MFGMLVYLYIPPSHFVEPGFINSVHRANLHAAHAVVSIQRKKKRKSK